MPFDSLSSPASRSSPAGRIEVIAGCMFSGKTTRLIARLRLARDGGRSVIAFKHRIDDRYDSARLATHDHVVFDALRVADARDLLCRAENIDVIGIDEAQFFGEPLAAVACDLRHRGKRIVVAGIDNDAWGRPFAPMPDLRRLADDFLETTAPCHVCGRPARFSQRMVPVLSDYMIGGPEAYQARCQEHFEPLPAPSSVMC